MSFLSRSGGSAPNLFGSSSSGYRDLESTPRVSQSSRVMYTRDWRSALRTPPTYRIGNRTLRFNYHFALLLMGVFALFLVFYYLRRSSISSSDVAWVKSYPSSTNFHSNLHVNTATPNALEVYDKTYPLTSPLLGRGGVVTYRIAIIADLDTKSKAVKDDGTTVWYSYLKRGYLSYTESKNELAIKWDNNDPVKLESTFSQKDRGMELSELVTFNGKLLSFDDRTGLVYEIVNDKPIPWVILLDGNGNNAKGFKSEWATVKNRELYVGSMGKEWTTSMGDFENENPMWVKIISTSGAVRSVDWSSKYKQLRHESQSITWPGYMIHESGMWSDWHKKWYFLPRRCSKEKYNETRDEHMGCNILISADEKFLKIETVVLDASNKTPTHGFSSFKFVPGTKDRIILALKSEELNGKTSSFVTAFDIEGKTILPEQQIETTYKFEGIEFI